MFTAILMYMMDLLNIPALITLSGAITAIGGAWLTIRKIVKDSERKKKQQAAEILQLAKQADQELRGKIENRVHDLEVQLKSLKENTAKDLDHLRDTYNGELKFLGQKIEELRSEVRNQHGQLVALLSKMLDKKR